MSLVGTEFPFRQRVSTTPIGAKSAITVNVTTTATLVAPANGRRVSLTLYLDAGTVYLGDSTVSPSSYMVKLTSGQTLVDDASYDAWYAITASGTATLYGVVVTA
jgi:hypothetical protein